MRDEPLYLPLFVVDVYAVGKIEEGENTFIFKLDKTLYKSLAKNFEEGESDIQVRGQRYQVLDQTILEHLKYSMVQVQLEVIPI